MTMLPPMGDTGTTPPEILILAWLTMLYMAAAAIAVVGGIQTAIISLGCSMILAFTTLAGFKRRAYIVNWVKVYTGAGGDHQV